VFSNRAIQANGCGGELRRLAGKREFASELPISPSSRTPGRAPVSSITGFMEGKETPRASGITVKLSDFAVRLRQNDYGDEEVRTAGLRLFERLFDRHASSALTLRALSRPQPAIGQPTCRSGHGSASSSGGGLAF
jgi:hypothetical protein